MDSKNILLLGGIIALIVFVFSKKTEGKPILDDDDKPDNKIEKRLKLGAVICIASDYEPYGNFDPDNYDIRPVNMKRWKNLLEYISTNKLADVNAIYLQDEDLTVNNVYKAIESLENDNDVNLFFFGGHGCYMEDYGHMLSLPDKMHIIRNNVKKNILSKNSKLSWIISDHCSSIAKVPANLIEDEKAHKQVKNSFIKKQDKITYRADFIKSLLNDYTGVFDIVSSKKGTVSYHAFNEDNDKEQLGNVFTYSFLSYFTEKAKQKPENYIELFNEANEKTSQIIKEVNKLLRNAGIEELEIPDAVYYELPQKKS